MLAASALQGALRAASEIPESVASPSSVDLPMPVASATRAIPSPGTSPALPVGAQCGVVCISPHPPMHACVGMTSSASRPPPLAVAALWSSLAHMSSVPMPAEIIASASVLQQWMFESSVATVHHHESGAAAAAAALLNLRSPSSCHSSGLRGLAATGRDEGRATAVIPHAPSLMTLPPSSTPEVGGDNAATSFTQQWIFANKGALGLFPSSVRAMATVGGDNAVDAAVIEHAQSASSGSSAEAVMSQTKSMGVRGRGRPRRLSRSTGGGTSSLRLLLPASLAPKAPRSESSATVLPAELTKESELDGTGHAGRPRMSWSKTKIFDQMSRSGQSRRWKKTGAITAALSALKTVGALTAGGVSFLIFCF